jgi:hypothetical protein
MYKRTRTLLAIIPILVACFFLAVIAYRAIGNRRMRLAVGQMGLPPGSTGRFLPAPPFGNSGYQVMLQPLDASQPAEIDQSIYGVPDTKAFIEVEWRIPASEEGNWQKSNSEVSYEIDIGSTSFKTDCKWTEMRGAESAGDPWIYLWADVPSLIQGQPHGAPVRIRAKYSPGPGETLNYKIVPIITSGGWE